MSVTHLQTISGSKSFSQMVLFPTWISSLIANKAAAFHTLGHLRVRLQLISSWCVEWVVVEVLRTISVKDTIIDIQIH